MCFVCDNSFDVQSSVVEHLGNIFLLIIHHIYIMVATCVYVYSIKGRRNVYRVASPPHARTEDRRPSGTPLRQSPHSVSDLRASVPIFFISFTAILQSSPSPQLVSVVIPP